jgi:hypothetical protein
MKNNSGKGRGSIESFSVIEGVGGASWFQICVNPRPSADRSICPQIYAEPDSGEGRLGFRFGFEDWRLFRQFVMAESSVSL